jgi:hypothetical protein
MPLIDLARFISRHRTKQYDGIPTLLFSLFNSIGLFSGPVFNV